MRKAVAVIVDFLAGLVGFAALLIVAAADEPFGRTARGAITAQVGHPARLEASPSLSFQHGTLNLTLAR